LSSTPRPARRPTPPPPAAQPIAAEPRAPAPVLDRVDECIIANLRRDGRMSNRDLARAAGVNEATIRARVRRLETSAAMRVVAMVDLQAAGFDFVAPVGIQVRGRAVAEVGAELEKIPQVMTVAVVIGPQDLEIQVVARDLAELANTLTEVIAKIPGVGRITPGLALQILKYESTWVPF
jgi:Lrp/AsnC family transcriptional regulator, regulator for asnA, asnC and gidA